MKANKILLRKTRIKFDRKKKKLKEAEIKKQKVKLYLKQNK